MSQKIGRNEPCPCGSGRKFKKCHGALEAQPQMNGSRDPRGSSEDGIKVTYRQTGETWMVGSSGMSLYSMVERTGDLQSLDSNPDGISSTILVDLPAFVPVEDCTIRIPVSLTECQVTISSKRRGDEQFSSLDTTTLPTFTSLKIVRQGVEGDPLSTLREVLKYLDDLAEFSKTACERLQDNQRFSIIVLFSRRGERRPCARAVYPLTGQYRLLDPKARLSITDELQRQLSRYRLELAIRAKDVAEHTKGQSLSRRVLAMLHDFAFFARQHPEPLQQLDEEQIRDLFVVPLKAIIRSAEAEAYSFNGKTDIKVINPDQQFEFGIIEFKKWRGPHSASAVYSQLVREHSTGQESFLIAALISDRQDVGVVAEEACKQCLNETETKEIHPHRQLFPSKEHFIEGVVQVRGTDIPLFIGIVDVYFKNVRARATKDSA